MQINHGILCKDIFLTTPKDKELSRKFGLYFKAYSSRNRYYVMMKKHAIDMLLKHDITLTEIGKIMGLDHSSIIFYRDRYCIPLGYKDFIKDNFWKSISKNIYPHYVGGNTNANRKLKFSRIKDI